MEDRFLMYLFYGSAIVLILILVFILLAVKRKNKLKKQSTRRVLIMAMFVCFSMRTTM